jgi:hypothetical protein
MVRRRRGLALFFVFVGALLIILGCTLLAVWLGLIVAGLWVGGFGLLLDDGE